MSSKVPIWLTGGGALSEGGWEGLLVAGDRMLSRASSSAMGRMAFIAPWRRGIAISEDRFMHWRRMRAAKEAVLQCNKVTWVDCMQQ